MSYIFKKESSVTHGKKASDHLLFLSFMSVLLSKFLSEVGKCQLAINPSLQSGFWSFYFTSVRELVIAGENFVMIIIRQVFP